jgi:hypothetical protein
VESVSGVKISVLGFIFFTVEKEEWGAGYLLALIPSSWLSKGHSSGSCLTDSVGIDHQIVQCNKDKLKIFFSEVLGFDVRTSCLPGRYSLT